MTAYVTIIVILSVVPYLFCCYELAPNLGVTHYIRNCCRRRKRRTATLDDPTLDELEMGTSNYEKFSDSQVLELQKPKPVIRVTNPTDSSLARTNVAALKEELLPNRASEFFSL